MDGKVVITGDSSGVVTAMQRAADAMRGVDDSGRRLIGTLAEQVKTFGMTNDQLTQYRARALGVGDEADKLQQRLQRMRDAQAAFGGSVVDSDGKLKNFGVSAGQTANAMRMLPAQLTDVATQLAGGQSPLLVMIQQGGQVKDMFGGFGPMFRGLAAAISPAVVGFGSLAAAAIALGYAFKAGTEESERLANSMHLTGNYAGITEGQFNSMAAAMGRGANTGIGTSREALEQLVATGRFTGDALQAVGQTALTFARISGQSASDVIKDFAGMADGVTKWVEKHNQQYHFLTAEQYAHIAALEREGQAQRAMQAAMDAFNDHLRTHAENITDLEKAWRAAGKAMSKYWDDVKSVFRDTTTDDKIALLEKQLEGKRRRLAVAQGTREGERLQRSVAATESELARLRVQKDLEETDKKSAALADQLHEKAQQAVKDNEAQARSMMSRRELGEEEVKRYQANQKAMIAAGMAGDSAEVQAAKIAKIRKNHQEQASRGAATPLQGWETELTEFKLKEQEKALIEGRFFEMSKEAERKFLSDKLALTSAGSKDQVGLRRRIAELGLSIMKEQFEAEQEGLRAQLAAFRDDYAKRDALAAKYAENAKQRYGVESKEYQAALRQQETIRREHEIKMRQIEMLRLDNLRRAGEETITENELVARMEFDLGLITRGQLIELERGFIQEKMRLDLQASEYELSLLQDGTVEYERALARKLETKRRYEGQLSAKDREANVEKRRPEVNINNSMQKSIEDGFTGMLMRAQTFRQAMAGISRSVGQTMIQEMVTRPFAIWAADWARKLAMNMGFLTTEQAQVASAALTGSLAKKATSLGEIMANAGVAASGAYAATAAIPYVGPLLAPAAAATAFAGASAYTAALFSAAGGFDIPKGMNPITQLHEEEMVIPARYANGLRDLINSGGAAAANSGPVINYHDHKGNLTPAEIRRNVKVIADALRDHSKKQ